MTPKKSNGSSRSRSDVNIATAYRKNCNRWKSTFRCLTIESAVTSVFAHQVKTIAHMTRFTNPTQMKRITSLILPSIKPRWLVLKLVAKVRSKTVQAPHRFSLCILRSPFGTQEKDLSHKVDPISLQEKTTKTKMNKKMNLCLQLSAFYLQWNRWLIRIINWKDCSNFL